MQGTGLQESLHLYRLYIRRLGAESLADETPLKLSDMNQKRLDLEKLLL